MKKVKVLKRIVSLILAFMTAIILMPNSLTGLKAEAKASVAYFGICGSNLTWELTTDNVLTISGSGKMENYSEEYSPWFRYWGPEEGYKAYIQNIVVNEGVTGIGNWAFYDLPYLETVSLPSSVNTIGEGAFMVLPIKSIRLPSSLTSIGEYAFGFCDELRSLSVPDSVKQIGNYAFFECEALQSVTIPGSASYGDGVLGRCTALTDVIIKPGLTRLPYDIFHGCTALKSIVLPEGLEIIDNCCFQDCSSLRQVSLPKSVSHVFGFAFDGCNALKEIDYGGNESDWNKIYIDEWNDPLTKSAKVYYNSYNPFIDISAANWFFKPVLWASGTGVTSGTSAITFEPNKTCTRAEFVTFLYKFVGKPWKASWAKECSFSDVKTTDWYYKAVVWANHAGVTNGVNGKFLPNEILDRGMIISFLYNMEKYQNGKPAITLKTTKFKDVKAGSYYYTPVLWAQQYNITSGTSATTFSPEKKCTRAEAVSFLYNIDKYWKK